MDWPTDVQLFVVLRNELNLVENICQYQVFEFLLPFRIQLFCSSAYLLHLELFQSSVVAVLLKIFLLSAS